MSVGSSLWPIGRSLRRSPTFSAATILTLAIGLGATTAVFTVLNAVLLRPLPFANPDRLVGVWMALPSMHMTRAPQSEATYYAFKRFAHSIDGIAIADRTSINVADGAGGSPPVRLHAALVTASFFPLLGTTFERGRPFSDAEDAPNGPAVAVISGGLWRSRFGGDPAIVGKAIQIDGRQREIIGVAASRFAYPEAETEVWLPLALDPHMAYAGAFSHQTFARLRVGVTMATAEHELAALTPRAAEITPAIAPGLQMASFLQQSGAHPVLHSMRDDVIGTFGGVLWIAAAAAVLLLVISAANVASLVLTRTEGRRREIAIRVALGAGSVRLASQLFVETAILAAVGGGAGLVLAWIGVALFRDNGPRGMPRLAEIGMDLRVAIFSLCATTAVATACTLLPIVRARQKSLSLALRDGGRGGTTGRDRQGARRTLVVVQVAFAVVLVASATMLLRTVDRLRTVRAGFNPEPVLTLWLSLPVPTYPTDTDVVRFTQRVLDRMTEVPGVRAVGMSSKLPLETLGRGGGPVWADDDKTPAGVLPATEQFTAISGGYFAAMGIPLIAGRTFDRLDRQSATDVIIDQTIAAQYWGDSTGIRALGRRLKITPTASAWLTVVGVAASVHDTSLAAPPTGILYFADAVNPDPNQSAVNRLVGLTIRGTGDPLALSGAVQRAIAGMDHALPAFDVRPLSDVVNQSLGRLTFVMVILALVAGVALSLAAIGLYGVIAYVVAMRRKEIGVRIALGAAPSGVSRMVARQGVGLAALGVVVGMVAFLGASRFLGAKLAIAGRVDGATLLTVSALLLIVALVASWVPARNAGRIDPVRAMDAD